MCQVTLNIYTGLTVEPHRRQLHITMAHQYLPEHHSVLEELALKHVDPTQPAKWELRLYSRDIRLATSEVSHEMELPYMDVIILIVCRYTKYCILTLLVKKMSWS